MAMKIFMTIGLMCLTFLIQAQTLTGSALLEKAIEYHDPKGQWSNFTGKLSIDMEMPNKPTRHSVVSLSNKEDFFRLEVTQGEIFINRKWENGECTFSLNGSNDITEEQRKKHGLTCERTAMYKNYYTYLYGLPMKLQDQGAIVHPEVTQVKAFNSEYLKLKVTYDPEVGNDTWYFYFNTESFALEAYQFFHDESKNDGEYIILTDIMEINGIKIPKVRNWYYNKNQELLGTDFLSKAEDL